MSRKQNFDPFDDLIDELQNGDERPSIPPTFKTNLRHQLLKQYEKPRFFWGNVRQWAGTAVALGALAFIIVYAWSIISQPPEAGDTVAVTRPATLAATTLEPTTQATATIEASVTPTLLAEAPEGLAQWPIAGMGILELLDVSISQPVTAGQPMLVHFTWRAPSQLNPNYTVSAHLSAQNGELLVQADAPLREESVVYNDTAYINTFLSLWLPETATPGSYSLGAMVYDNTTGEQLKQDNNETELYVFDVQVLVAEALPDNNPNNVWLVSATQHARSSVSDPIVLDITIGYEIESDEDVTLEVLYAPSDWDSQETAPHPMLNLQERIPLPDKAGVYTFTFTESPEAMLTFVGTDHPVIVMKLVSAVGTVSNGVQSFDVLATVEAIGFFIDLNRTIEMQYNKPDVTAVTTPEHAPNDVWLISATQHARSSADAVVTLEITVGYQFESDEEVILKPLYANPNWESASGERSPIDGLSEAITLTEKSGIQTIIFSASPAEMRQIVGTDQPVLVMQLGYLSDDGNGRRELNILAMPTITDFAIDLTNTEEVAYESDFSIGASPTQTEDAGPVYLESIVQKERHTAVVTVEVILEHTLPDATTQLFLVNPDWDYDLTNIQSFQRFMPQPGQPGLFVTATSDQIREATGTDHPIVAAIIEPSDPSNGTAIVQKFPQFPFDLTNNEEIRYTPVNDKSNWNYLEIIELSPPVSSILSNETTFTVTVKYNLVSMDTAVIFTLLLPYQGGDAIVGDDVQTISRGQGELTFSFNFELLETGTTSDWLLELRMHDPAEGISPSALATTMPHDNFPNDLYHFEP